MSRKPDYILKVKPKGEKGSGGRMGCAWVNEGGSLSVRLDPGVVLDWRMSGEGMLITLFPTENDKVDDDRF